MSNETLFANMTLEKRLMFLYQQELNHSATLQHAIDALNQRFSAADTITNDNMNSFFLIVNAIIVFIVQV